MYKIIGIDSSEYGPYSAEDLRNLILERRANAATVAKPESGGEWRPLSDYPEFADALQQAATLPPTAMGGDGDPSRLRLADLLDESWALFRQRPGLLIGVTLMVILMSLLIGMIPVAGQILSPILFGPLFAGVGWISLKLARQESVSVADVFVGFKAPFLPLLLCGIVHQILVALGLILLIIPGIYLVVSWTFPFLLIVDRDLPFWTAMELSRKTVGKRFFWFLGMWVVAVIILIVAAIPCGLGLLIAGPLLNNLFAVAYKRTFDSPAIALEPPTNPVP